MRKPSFIAVRRSSLRDDGATIVEAAFAIPIFFLIFFGLIDFGLAGLNDTQAGNAARDGVRVGAIRYLEADEPGSDDWNAIKAAIDKNLPDRSVGSDITLEVECIDVQTDTVVDCEDPSIRVDVDKINVRVSWQHEFISPLVQALGFNVADLEGDATSVIIGSPVAGGTVGNQPCSVTGVTVSPDPVTRYASGPDAGTLYDDLSIVVTGSGVCDNLSLVVADDGGGSATVCSGGCIGTHSFAADAGAFWTAGSASATVTDLGGESPSASDTFTIVDDALPECSVTASVSPDSVLVNTNSGHLESNLTLTISATGDCTSLAATLYSPNGNTVPVCTGDCSATFTYSKNADSFWTVGTGRLEVLDGATVEASSTFTVNAKGK